MNGNKVLRIFLLTLVAVFVLHQLYSSLYKPISTESAEYFEAVDGINVNVTVIRNESVIVSNLGGSLHFTVQNGTRVAKGGTIATVYSDSTASVAVSRINELTAQIDDIKEISSYNDRSATDLDLINSKVDSGLNKLIRDNKGGNFTNVTDNTNNLLSVINRRQMITGEQIDFTAKLTELQSELDNLNRTLPAAKGHIKAPLSGYFVSSQDGYENLLKSDKLDSITPELLATVKPEPKNSAAVGKTVSDYEWYLAATVSLNDSLKYKEGDVLTLKTNMNDTPILDVSVKQINIPESSDKAVVVFACHQMSSELALVRNLPVTVISKSYSGLKVSKNALHVVSGETGVFVLNGAKLKFVPATVIYSTDEYILCKQEKSNENVLRLYDEVVVKGKKLYDGKIVG